MLPGSHEKYQVIAVRTIMYGVMKIVVILHDLNLPKLAKWLIIRLRTKWLWLQIPLHSIKTYNLQET